MAPKPSKNTTAWWLVSKSTNMPAAIKRQIDNQKSKASPTQTWIALGKLLATYNFAASPFCTTSSLLRTILEPASCGCPKVVILTQLPFAVEMWAQNGPNNKHSLAEHSCQVASTTLTVASLRAARPGYHYKMAGVELDRCASGHEMSNRQSEKQSFPNHKPGSPWENGKLVATYNFAASPFLHCMISTLVAVPKLRFLRSCFLCREHSLEEHLWHVASTTSTVASLRVARLGWLPSQAKRHRTAKLWHWSWNVKSTIS